MLEKRVSRNIRNIRGRIAGPHPVDYFENIITKRSAPRHCRREGSVAGKRERREETKKRSKGTRLSARGRSDESSLLQGTFRVSTVLHSVVLLRLVPRRRRFHSSSESRLVMGRIDFVIHGRTLQPMCPRLIPPVFNVRSRSMDEDLRATVHLRVMLPR